ncbi:MAG: hypothetical protein ACI9XO_003912 [Paraglaciecola sp.]|jgi:hypothetical protein
MKLLKFNKKPAELPVKIMFSAEKMIEEVEKYAQLEGHVFQNTSKDFLVDLQKCPQLRTGFENLEDIEMYKEEIDLLLKTLFPDSLQKNEIKAIVMPFTFEGFHPTARFAQILDDAGEDFRMDLANFTDGITYIYACSFILAKYHEMPIDFGRPMYLDIPNQKTGKIRHYRALMNADLTEIIKTDSAPDITKEDIDYLLQNADNVEVWKEKFPPESYIFKGFCLVNLFDVTQDVIINKIRSLFLRNDDQVYPDFQKALQNLMNIDDLMVGYSTYDLSEKQSLGTFFNQNTASLFLEENERINYQEVFCDGIQNCVMQNAELIAMPNVRSYGEKTGFNNFYKRLAARNIGSLVLVPLRISDRYLQLLELGTIEKNKLNALNANKLKDIIPYVKIAAQRYMEENLNILESTIQENYTSLHPTVKWRFDRAAINFNRQKIEGITKPFLEDISFDQVYPIYAQADIKGSSTARNQAIQKDLETQLNMVLETFETILSIQDYPIYKKLVYRVGYYLKIVQKGLDAGDELTILDFLKAKIYPVFNHLKNINPVFEKAISVYMAEIDSNLHVVYRVRKAYDESVEMLNDQMANYLDGRQAKAQEMYPHYFQRYKTDGVEYNIYIGGGMVENQEFYPIYLQNLRMWQLETMWGLEQVADNLLSEMSYPLQVASLILVHSHPLSIKFHMDQKAFDVDGAYNARYEIVKKRIDKSHIKGTTERLTQTRKIAIVYSQDSDAEEYLEYIKYWQSEGLFGKVEMLELQDLQGVSGLRAIRVEVLYEKESNGKNQESSKKVAAKV